MNSVENRFSSADLTKNSNEINLDDPSLFESNSNVPIPIKKLNEDLIESDYQFNFMDQQ